MNMPNAFIYAVARAEGIDWLRGFTNLHKTGKRRVKLWYIRRGFKPVMFERFKKIIEAALPGAVVLLTENDNNGPMGCTSIQVWL